MYISRNLQLTVFKQVITLHIISEAPLVFWLMQVNLKLLHMICNAQSMGLIGLMEICRLVTFMIFYNPIFPMRELKFYVSAIKYSNILIGTLGKTIHILMYVSYAISILQSITRLNAVKSIIPLTVRKCDYFKWYMQCNRSLFPYFSPIFPMTI